ncbi:Glutathione-regulated potassium-efflux system protein KefC [Nymphon striatum]|nr:Glutathione-regulated potassium-efflux system protein KefC [Nymphon striatum]
MGDMLMTDFLMLAFVFLVAGVIAVPIASRLGLGSVLGYLIAGILISPVLALLGVDVIAIQHFAEFGVVMMLFLVGLELEPKLLWAMRARLIGLGGGQVALTTLAVMAIAMALGQIWTVALAIGLVMALSSTAIVLQTLNEKGLMKSDGGQSSFSVLLTQDIAVIPMLAFIPLLALSGMADVGADIATHGEATHVETVGDSHGDNHASDDHSDGHGDEGHGSSMSLVDGLGPWMTALVTIGAVAAVVLGGNFLTSPIFRFISGANLRELFTATALMMVIGIALLMSLVGLSPALGTFLAGVVLANSEYRHELESDIDPFKGLLLGLFFMTVGAGIDFGLLQANVFGIVAMTIGLITIKAAVLWVLAIVFKIHGADRWLFALGLAQAGEFGFGMGAWALSLVRMLQGAGYSATVIDYSSKQIEFLAQFGFKAYYGDATRPDLLHSAGIEDAKVLVVAIDQKEQTTALVHYVHVNHPHVHIVARAVDRMHVYDLWHAGCRDIIRETFDGATRMGRSVYEAMGASRAKADLMVQAFVATDGKSMRDLAEHYDPNVTALENQPYMEKAREMIKVWDAELIEDIKGILASDDVEKGS